MLEGGGQRVTVSKIANLKFARAEFDAQSAALMAAIIVYQGATYRCDLIARWVPDPVGAAVPAIIIDTVVALTDVDDPGRVVASGPADATGEGESERLDLDVEAARQARYISAFEPEPSDLNRIASGAMVVTSLLQQIAKTGASCGPIGCSGSGVSYRMRRWPTRRAR